MYRGVDLRLEIRGALYARREGGEARTDASTGEEGPGAGCLTLVIDLDAGQRRSSYPLSTDEPHQGEPAIHTLADASFYMIRA